MQKKISIDKKISFNKETISKLNDRQKELLKGGRANFEELTKDGGWCVSYVYTCSVI